MGARKAKPTQPREVNGERERMRALGHLAAAVAHDLGNTVNALALRVDLVARSVDARAKPHLAEIDTGISMIRDLLDRLDRFSGRRTAPAKPIDLRAVILAAIDEVEGESMGRDGRARIAVDVAVPRRLPRVAGHDGDLTLVFANLLRNARDAMPDGGTVTIDARANGTTVIARVIDDGSGFPPDVLPRVFEPFFSTKRARGSGLGLALAYGTMEALGGRIRAANRRGGGAELTLQLPIAPAPSRTKRRR